MLKTHVKALRCLFTHWIYTPPQAHIYFVFLFLLCFASVFGDAHKSPELLSSPGTAVLFCNVNCSIFMLLYKSLIKQVFIMAVQNIFIPKYIFTT